MGNVFFLKGPDIKVLFSNSAFDLKCYVMCGKGPFMNHMDMAGGGSFLKSILHLKAYLIKCSTKGEVVQQNPAYGILANGINLTYGILLLQTEIFTS